MQHIELKKESAEPLYSQIKNALKDFIDKNLNEGERVPSENELKNRFSVNRLTARKALIDLENAGVVYSVRGKGRFKSLPLENGCQMRDCCFAVFVGQARSGGSGFYVPFMNRLFEIQREQGCTIKIIGENELSKLEELSKSWKNFKGLIWTAPGNESFAKMKELRSSGVAVLGVLRNLAESEFPYVFIEQKKSSMRLVNALISNGHRQIGCVCTDRTLFYSAERWNGYKDALALANIPVEMHLTLEVLDSSIDFTDQAVDFIKRNPEMTGLFIAGERLQPPVMKALKKLGRKIPHDISVAAFDEVISNEFASVTCARQPLEKVADKCIGILMGNEEPAVYLETEIIDNGSIKKMC